MKRILKGSMASVLTVSMMFSAISPVYADEPSSVQEQTEKTWQLNKDNNIQYADLGENVILTVAFTSDSQTASCTYQWYENGALIEGATSQSYTVEDVELNATYVCKVSDGTNTEDDEFQIHVNKDWQISQTSNNVYVKAGESAVLEVLFDDEDEDTSAYTYQWYDANNKLVSSASVYTTAGLSTGTTYSCVVTDVNGNSETVLYNVIVRDIPANCEDFEVSFSSDQNEVSIDTDTIEINDQSYDINTFEALDTSTLVKSIRITIGNGWSVSYTFTFTYEDEDIASGTLTDITASGDVPVAAILTKQEVFTMKGIEDGPGDKYKITYDLDGGVNPDNAITTYSTKSDLDTYLQEPVKDGYVFEGWYLDADYKNDLEDIVDDDGVSGDITLYAKWGSPLEHGKLRIYYDYVLDGESYSDYLGKYSDFDLTDEAEIQQAIYDSVSEELCIVKIKSRESEILDDGVTRINIHVSCIECPSKGTLTIHFEDENSNEVGEVKTVTGTYIGDLEKVDSVVAANMINGYRLDSVDYGYAYKEGSVYYREVTAAVLAASNVTSVELSDTSKKVTVGDTFTLTYTLLPKKHGGSTKATWSSSDPSVATVSSSGKVTAVGQGKAEIYATSSDGCVGKCSVSVWPKTMNAPALSMDNDGITVTWDEVEGATSYKVYRKTGSKDWVNIYESTKCYLLDATVSQNSLYTYAIVACAGSTETVLGTNYSSVRYLKATSISSVENVSNGIKVTWNAKKYATGYKLVRTDGTYVGETDGTSLTDYQVETDQEYNYYVIPYYNSYATSPSETKGTVRLLGPDRVTCEIVDDGIQVEWDAVSGATYDVIINGETVKTDYASTSYLDFNVTSGTSYQYEIRARKDDSVSAATSATVVHYVSRPVVSSFANGASKMKATWSSVAGAISYNVKVINADTDEVLKEDTTPNTYYYFTSVESGVNTKIMVQAVGDKSATSKSVWGSKTTMCLASPVINNVQTYQGAAMITWDAIDGAEKYVVMRKVSGDKSWKSVGESKTASYVDEGILDGTTYIYTVKAFCGSDGSAIDAGTTVSIPDNTSSISWAMNTKGIKVSWKAVTGATGYFVTVTDITTGAIVIENEPVEKNAYTFTQAETGKEYTVTIATANGTSVLSSGTSKKIVNIEQANIQSVTNTDTGIHVEWNEAKGATRYKLYRKVYGDKDWTSLGYQTATSYDDTTAAAGTTYIYAIRAYYSSTSALWDSKGKTITRLAQPTVYKIENAESGLKVTRKAVTGATSYIVKCSNGSEQTITGKTATFKELTNNTSYTFTIIAQAEDGSVSCESKEKSYIRLETPLLRNAENTKNGIELTWSSVEGATSYRIYRKVKGASKWQTLKDVETTAYEDTSAEAGVTYVYTIRAYNESFGSYYYSGSAIMRLTAPKVTFASKSVKETWKAVTGATSYHYYVLDADTLENITYGDLSSSKRSYTYKAAVSGKSYIIGVYAQCGEYRSAKTEKTILMP